MKEYIAERALKEAKYIIQNNATAESTAIAFYSTKSSVYKDIERLKELDISLYNKVKEIFKRNKLSPTITKSVIKCCNTACRFNTAKVVDKVGSCNKAKICIVSTGCSCFEKGCV